MNCIVSYKQLVAQERARKNGRRILLNGRHNAGHSYLSNKRHLPQFPSSAGIVSQAKVCTIFKCHSLNDIIVVLLWLVFMPTIFLYLIPNDIYFQYTIKFMFIYSHYNISEYYDGQWCHKYSETIA